MVAAGMHHGMVALYSIQLQELGFITLYPALAMAGAGQVGAALALLKKVKKKDLRLSSVIRGALPAGFLGVGEPLIYGVTLPLGKPFITAGLGAGFGGAFVMLMQVASTTWGPSGLLGIFVMTQGPQGAVKSIICYLIGLLISYVMSFIITYFFVKIDAEVPGVSSAVHKKVKHGEEIILKNNRISGALEFTYIIKDPLGIHARPAGELSKIIKKYHCQFCIEANGKIAKNGSVMQLMSLDATCGTELKCRAEGEQAAEAMDEVMVFMQQKL